MPAAAPVAQTPAVNVAPMPRPAPAPSNPKGFDDEGVPAFLLRGRRATG
jgi:hypothetical protein